MLPDVKVAGVNSGRVSMIPRPVSRFSDVFGFGSDSGLAAARAAGWRNCDLGWERMQERAHAALKAGNGADAARLWRRAWWLAMLRFSRDDPRYATSLANAGMAARLTGNEVLAQRRYARALVLWSSVPTWVEGMTIARRGRSSLFHLRMETQHWDAYQGSMRRRATGFMRETAACLHAAAHGTPTPIRLHSRWRGEKPAVFDDLRKFLGAALLLAVGEQPGPEA